MSCTFTRTLHNVTYHCHKFEHHRNSYIKLAEIHECLTPHFWGIQQDINMSFFKSDVSEMSLRGGSYMLHPSVLKENSKSLSCFPKVFRRCKATGSMLDTVDASSMLCRLEMEGKLRATTGIHNVSLSVEPLSALRKLRRKSWSSGLSVTYHNLDATNQRLIKILELARVIALLEIFKITLKSSATFVNVLLMGWRATAASNLRSFKIVLSETANEVG